MTAVGRNNNLNDSMIVFIITSMNRGMVSSGSVEQPGSPKTDLKLEGGGQGLHNPLAWDSVPSSLKEKFPHWKERTPLAVELHSHTCSEGMAAGGGGGSWKRDVSKEKGGRVSMICLAVLQGRGMGEGESIPCKCWRHANSTNECVN